MKSLFYLFFMLGLCLSWANPTTAQVGGESRMGNGGAYWIFGLNAGGAWQDSDVKARPGGGWGFYMGPSIYNKPNSFFSADLRFRYLNTYTYGQNHKDELLGNSIFAPPAFNYDPTTKAFAHNYRTVFHDLSLELRVNFEELRRKTNVWLSLYGGVGLGIYGTTFDQKDALGLDYDYESIDQTQTDDAICRDILSLRDDTYETSAFGLDRFDDNLFKLGFMPSVGIELGYWFTPYFALGIGHRATFTLQDNFEGVKVDNGKALNSSVHHYTSFMLHWRVMLSRGKISCPDVQFELPTSNGSTYTTSNPTVFVKAAISNVNQKQITYTVNGQQSFRFSYDESTDDFKSNLPLQEGENHIVLKAKNGCGTSGQAIVVIYKPKRNQHVAQPPVVTITYPGANATNVTNPTINISAQLLHVTDKRNVVFNVNGNTGHPFGFSGTSFQANNVNLVPGQNTITIQGTNKDGSDSKTLIVNYQKEEPLPIVTIIRPSSNPYTTNASTINLGATILNVSGRNDITFSINGRNSTNFSFSGRSFSANNIPLVKGSNTLTITGRNRRGQDSKSTVIIYQQEKTPPVVTITRPTQNPYTTTATSTTITATILNVVGASNISYTVNGRSSNNFSFSGTSFSATLNLVQGNNTITITGRNQDGQDTKTTAIVYQKIVQKPTVTITYPRTNPYASPNQTEQVNATITNVTSRNDVTCTVNGRTNTSFTFSNNSFSLNAINLGEGNNTITITGRNQAGQDTKSTVIFYRPVVVERPPEVSIVAPRTNPYTTQSAKETVSATINNVTGRNNVTCTVNGRVNTNFSFSGTNFTLANLNLQKGNNTITITGRNGAGQDTKSTLIIYQPVVQLPRPVVTITEPTQNPYTTPSARFSILATILNVATRNDVVLTVNGVALSNFNFAGTNFSASNILLKAGNNTISITGRNASGQDTKTTIVIYKEPVQEPSVVITSPSQNPLTVQNASINILATIKNVSTRNDVSFSVNGQNNSNFSFSGTSFSANNIRLNTGNNTFVISGQNETGQATATTVVIYRPALPPVVTITSPNQNPLTTQAGTVNLSATISNVSAKSGVILTVNGQNTNNFSFSNGILTAQNIGLKKGQNTLTVTGKNTAGQDAKSTAVIFNRPKPAPTVTITSPNQNPFNTQISKVNIKATLTNVASRNDITFTVNGQANTGFSFSGSELLAGNIVLKEGNNTFTITGRNASGQDTKSTVVIYTKPVERPLVKFTNPVQSPFTTLANRTNIAATILNVIGKNNVVFTVNGQLNYNFTFSGTSFKADNLPLNVGNNTLVITGRNAAGQDTKTMIVVYKLPQKKPTVVITSPNQNPFNTQSNRVNITANVLNVANKGKVQFTVNGQSNTNFSLTGTAFVANGIALNSGNNTFVITGTNGAGQATASTVVIYRAPIQEPSVVITSPNQNPFNTQINKVNILATIRHVATKNNVSFVINGQPSTNFSFSGTSFVANNISLNPGSNTFVIRGSNASGQVSATTTVIYTPLVPLPTVVITLPNANPWSTPAPNTIIRASLQNVANANDVTFAVNGQVLTNFVLNGTAFEANNVVLTKGSNTIVITAKNSRGTATANTVIVHTPLDPTGGGTTNTNQQGGGANNTGSGAEGEDGGSKGKTKMNTSEENPKGEDPKESPKDAKLGVKGKKGKLSKDKKGTEELPAKEKKEKMD
ncbi:beta strand repeat-containing protein [Aureispira anguillae]|uniref:Uncharacterized protein n=1 Tax=Aureispira anguillae TaxID=2864201 RepID=A0A915YA00_9BACT|nr:hypothetical protein [Aureispira anguillae]BDS09704.1 hypothetical protein AsAng_0004080 [Aureispira anguillae]